MKAVIGVGVVVAAMLAPSFVSAQMRPRDPAAAFDKADADKDGQVSRAEYMAARTSNFDRLDRNGDGVISKADFPRLRQRAQAAAKLDAMIDEADANKDGQVTRAELADAPTPIFDRADADKDGAVSQAEIAALKASRNR